MLEASKITRRASEILASMGIRSELSEQARAVIEAICEIGNNNQLLVSQALIKRINAVKKTPTGRMKKPTLEEVRLAGAKIGLPEGECDRFFSFYESKGWKVGKSPMKLWTAALANWKRSWQEKQSTTVNGNVAAIQNQTALTRIEDRIKYLRGQAPLTEAKLKTEWNELCAERRRLMTVLGFKA